MENSRKFSSSGRKLRDIAKPLTDAGNELIIYDKTDIYRKRVAMPIFLLYKYALKG